MSTKSLSIVRNKHKQMDPATVYLATLTPSSRSSMYYMLKAAIRILGSKRSVENYNWGSLCYADMITGQLNVSQTKGNKDRTCFLPKMTRALLYKWLRKRGDESGALFCRTHKSGTSVIKPLTTQAIYNIVQTRATGAGLGKLRPHDMRRSFLTRLLEANVDINTVRLMVGHSDISTTSRYDLCTPNAKQIVEILL